MPSLLKPTRPPTLSEGVVVEVTVIEVKLFEMVPVLVPTNPPILTAEELETEALLVQVDEVHATTKLLLMEPALVPAMAPTEAETFVLELLIIGATKPTF